MWYEWKMEEWSKRWFWVGLSSWKGGKERQGEEERRFFIGNRLLKAGIDWTKIGQLSVDRKVWKGRVREHMDHLRQWEWSTGHKWTEAGIERNMPKEVVFVCDVCEKLCKSKAGLTIHRKRMHEESSLKKVFKCDACEREFKQEANLKNHVKVCTGGDVEGEKIRCDACGKSFKRKGYPRHRSAWRGGVGRGSGPSLQSEEEVLSSMRH